MAFFSPRIPVNNYFSVRACFNWIWSRENIQNTDIMADKKIDEIDDFSEMLKILKILDISEKGLKSLDEMKDKAKEKIRKKKSEEQGNPTNSTTVRPIITYACTQFFKLGIQCMSHGLYLSNMAVFVRDFGCNLTHDLKLHIVHVNHWQFRVR